VHLLPARRFWPWHTVVSAGVANRTTWRFIAKRSSNIDWVLASVAVQLALIARCGASPPRKAEAESPRAKVFDIFDRELDNLDPVKSFKEARRKVIAQTMDEWVQASASRCVPHRE
jgi:hypothetical protein